jgi:hypothetical protein
MKLKILALTLAAAFFSGPAFAGHCPKDAAAIDAALEKMTLSDEVRVEVVALRDQGMALHEQGDHAASEAALADAMRRLLLAQ